MDRDLRLVWLYCVIEDAVRQILGETRLRSRGPTPALTDVEALTIEIFGETLGDPAILVGATRSGRPKTLLVPDNYSYRAPGPPPLSPDRPMFGTTSTSPLIPQIAPWLFSWLHDMPSPSAIPLS
jgi:hypothetical protein